jgi:hypothetical protein
MPKVKKPYKKRKTKKHEAKTKNKNKNKNIIKINVSNQGSGGGSGSSTIPIPYPISSQMFPTNQPLNIYNTMSRNPYDTVYNPPEKVFQEEPKKITNEPNPEPISLKFRNPFNPENDFSLKSQLDQLRENEEAKLMEIEDKNIIDILRENEEAKLMEIEDKNVLLKKKINRNRENEIRRQLKYQGKTNKQIGQLIRGMKKRGEI